MYCFFNNDAEITGKSWYFAMDVNCEKKNQIASLLEYIKRFTYLPSKDFRKEVEITVTCSNLQNAVTRTVVLKTSCLVRKLLFPQMQLATTTKQ